MQEPALILVIDGDPFTQQLLHAVLTSHGYRVEVGRDGEEGIRKFLSARPDLVLLNLQLPGKDAIQVCSDLVAIDDVPIILVAPDTDEDSLVAGLDAGAVGFVIKPFSSRLLLARIKAGLRAFRPATSDPVINSMYRDEYISIDLDGRLVRVQGKSVRLTPTEFHLLSYLLTNSGRICTYRELLEKVWGWEYHDSVEYLYTYVRRLRSKLQPHSDSPQYIVAERQIGYRFKPLHGKH